MMMMLLCLCCWPLRLAADQSCAAAAARLGESCVCVRGPGMVRERPHVRWGGWANILRAMTTMEVGPVVVGLVLAVAFVVALAVVGDSSGYG